MVSNFEGLSTTLNGKAIINSFSGKLVFKKNKTTYIDSQDICMEFDVIHEIFEVDR